MPLYAAFDLHAKTNHLGIIDHNGKRIMVKKLANEPSLILETLKPMRRRIVGIVVESTYNWYWLVDLLMEAGYKVHLANPCVKNAQGRTKASTWCCGTMIRNEALFWA